MECYNFLLDEDELRKFHSTVLPELGQDEVRYLMVGSRRKYLTDAEKLIYNCNGTDMLKRVTIRSNKYEALRDGVLDFCVAKGRYRDKNGLSLPETSFTIYITPNARDCRRASVGIVQKITEGLLNPNTPLRLENMVLSEIHKYSTNKVYLDLDCDPDEGDDLGEVLTKIYEIIGNTNSHTIKTRSGAHVLVEKETIDPKIKNTFYKDIQKLSDSMQGCIEWIGDSMTPLPGTSQGGKMPYLMDK